MKNLIKYLTFKNYVLVSFYGLTLSFLAMLIFMLICEPTIQTTLEDGTIINHSTAVDAWAYDMQVFQSTFAYKLFWKLPIVFGLMSISSILLYLVDIVSDSLTKN